MPWIPEAFVAPIAGARRAQEAARVNDAVAYYEGIMAGENPTRSCAPSPHSPSWMIPASAAWRARGVHVPLPVRRRTGCAAPWWRAWRSRAPPPARSRMTDTLESCWVPDQVRLPLERSK